MVRVLTSKGAQIMGNRELHVQLSIGLRVFIKSKILLVLLSSKSGMLNPEALKSPTNMHCLSNRQFLKHQ
ncbi:hypothetical protein Trydic_g15531 [Trypoxylus dichotomus]